MRQQSTSLTIAIGSDHHGFAHKEHVKAHVCSIDQRSIYWFDVGAYSPETSDYPIFAAEVCHAIVAKEALLGILFCGTGVGMCIAANRFRGIYAGIAWNRDIAIRGRQEDNTNVLVLPSDCLTENEVVTIIQSWLQTSFLDGHYAQRVSHIDRIKTDGCCN